MPHAAAAAESPPATRLEAILADEFRTQAGLAAKITEILGRDITRFRVHLIVRGMRPEPDEAAAIAEALKREIADVFPPMVPA